MTIRHPINLGSKAFNDDKYAHYAWLRDEAPVYKGKLLVLNVYFLSRYDDCVALLRDPRFVRNRTTATGGSRLPVPLPRSVRLLAESMIIADDPEHRRLRSLVSTAFTPRALQKIEARIEALTHELVDRMAPNAEVELTSAYSSQIPATVMSELLGVEKSDMPKFSGSLRALTNGMSGWNLLRTFLWDLRRSTGFVRELIARKRENPQDDILTGLIQAENEGERLSDDELISMAFLLIIAGFETTVHLINNSVVTLLEHPDQLQRLREQPELIDSAIEEVLRFNGPIHGTKPAYPVEDVTIRGVTIPRGATVSTLLGAANRDPAAFENPDSFDIARTPNHHLGFGHGNHFCLGARLARLETRLALSALLARAPRLRLAVAPSALKLQRAALWHRYERVPVLLD